VSPPTFRDNLADSRFCPCSLVNHAPIPIPDCQSGPEKSCPTELFADFIGERKELFGDFVTACNLTSQTNATDVYSIFEGVIPADDPKEEEDE
jgi:hypothetical protein